MAKKIIPLLIVLGLLLSLTTTVPVLAGTKTGKKVTAQEQQQRKKSVEKRNAVRRAVEAEKRSSGECAEKGKCIILDEELLNALHASGDEKAAEEFKKAINKKKALMKKRIENPTFEEPYREPLPSTTPQQ